MLQLDPMNPVLQIQMFPVEQTPFLLQLFKAEQFGVTEILVAQLDPVNPEKHEQTFPV